jgi:hypothetical protein
MAEYKLDITVDDADLIIGALIVVAAQYNQMPPSAFNQREKELIHARIELLVSKFRHLAITLPH